MYGNVKVEVSQPETADDLGHYGYINVELESI